jgi:hypothetical protein
MDEAIQTIAPLPSTVIAPAVRASMGRAVMVLALQAAIKEAKRALAAKGLKPTHYSQREIVEMAKARLLADAQHRAELIAEARKVVAVWEAEGYFRQRRASQSVRKDRELRTLNDREQRECRGNGQ